MLVPGHRYTPTELLPHDGNMRLIDTLEDYGPDWVRCSVVVAGRGLFGDEDGKVPGWLGLEYMAQTAAVYAGIEQLQAGAPVTIGLLIGTRRYECSVPYFRTGSRLDVIATLLMRDGDTLAVFDCTVANGKEVLARAEVKAFRPDDINELLRNNA
jgi:predicted hotdog family 3-hydroxylacyl-ACP dehydratase